MLRFKNLGSGSTGNATVVEGRSGSQVRRLLIDCGLGIRQLQARLAQAQLQVEDLDALLSPTNTPITSAVPRPWRCVFAFPCG